MKSLILTTAFLVTVILQSTQPNHNNHKSTRPQTSPTSETLNTVRSADIFPRITSSLVKYQYNKAGDITQKIMIDQALNDSIIEYYIYNEDGLLVESYLAKSNHTLSKKKHYLIKDKINKTDYLDGSDSIYLVKEYKYDELDRLYEETVINRNGLVKSITQLKLAEDGKVIEKEIKSFLY